MPTSAPSIQSAIPSRIRALKKPRVWTADAKQTNAQFESKLLLKNQQQGIINWAK